jgi:hypothetical protein
MSLSLSLPPPHLLAAFEMWFFNQIELSWSKLRGASVVRVHLPTHKAIFPAIMIAKSDFVTNSPLTVTEKGAGRDSPGQEDLFGAAGQ